MIGLIKAGRFTAAVLFVTVGVSMLLDRAAGTHMLGQLISWWPLLFVAAGLELILLQFLSNSREAAVKLDPVAIFFSVVICAVVAGSQGFSQGLLSGLNLKLGVQSRSFDKEPAEFLLSPAITQVHAFNTNGRIELAAGDGDAVRIQATVWVNDDDEQEARKTADASHVEQSIQGTELTLKAVGEEYTKAWFVKNKARIDITVTLPRTASLDYLAETENGAVQAAGLRPLNLFSAHTSNGSVELTDIQGHVEAVTTNGKIIVSSVSGAVKAQTVNGEVVIRETGAGVQAAASNGKVTLSSVKGDAVARTDNGSVKIKDVSGRVQAETENGSVRLESAEMAGDWQASTNKGRITIRLPGEAGFKVQGSARVLHTGLPVRLDEEKLSGTVGSGEHILAIRTDGEISLETVN
ncbi:DUF4097 family beta strand repeat-containing protein [Paenibacillus chitinolyticus]|uniref:DUF4097 family beta strand repeat-containing protein n=1 Tax=Paenibacillus chitinolyticus TaxID=79263 RepID=UPI002DB6F688|nr:DUF4097 family beta strand repeat-containing protein [Paenibacillus chitinolyticus]MEC0248325.1 DUF4097 family beta strand repeat-containing protein [Paenibacillus chitinolyticus]